MKLRGEPILNQFNEHWNSFGVDQAMIHDHIFHLERLLEDYRALVGPLTFREPDKQLCQAELLRRTKELFGEQDQ